MRGLRPPLTLTPETDMAANAATKASLNPVSSPHHQKAVDSAALEAQMAAFLRQGGTITALDYAGKPVGVATEDLPDAGIAPVADVPAVPYGRQYPSAAPVARPVARPVAPVVVAVPAAHTAPAAPPPAVPERSADELIAELRAIRRKAQAALQMLQRLAA